MRIVIDTREQRPYRFTNYPAETVAGTLTSGDYSLEGMTDQIAVERKSLEDLLGCLTHDRERFLRELERLRSYQSAAVVVEAPLLLIQTGRYRSQMRPEAAMQSLISIIQEYRMPIWFCRDRTDAEKFVFDFLRHFIRHRKKDRTGT